LLLDELNGLGNAPGEVVRAGGCGRLERELAPPAAMVAKQISGLRLTRRHDARRRAHCRREDGGGAVPNAIDDYGVAGALLPRPTQKVDSQRRPPACELPTGTDASAMNKRALTSYAQPG